MTDDRTPTRLLWLMLTALTLSVLAGCATNPISGDDELMFYSVEDDFALGKAVAPEILKYLDGRIPDEGLQRYIDRIGQKIALVCHRPDWEYHFTAVEHESVNALALPGGYIYITRGMLEKLETEAQLAAILGHETTHVVARHSMAQISKRRVMNVATLATLVSGAAPPEVMQLTMITNQIMTMQYSRQDEKEADLAGLDYMVAAGYDPNGMLEIMRILQKEHPGGKQYEFFSTHPHPENRFYYIQDKIDKRYPDRNDLRRGRETYQDKIADYLKTHPKPKKSKRERQALAAQQELQGLRSGMGVERHQRDPNDNRRRNQQRGRPTPSEAWGRKNR